MPTITSPHTDLAMPYAQNLAVIVVWILERHMGQSPPAALMSLAQP